MCMSNVSVPSLHFPFSYFLLSRHKILSTEMEWMENSTFMFVILLNNRCIFFGNPFFPDHCMMSTAVS